MQIRAADGRRRRANRDLYSLELNLDRDLHHYSSSSSLKFECPSSSCTRALNGQHQKVSRPTFAIRNQGRPFALQTHLPFNSPTSLVHLLVSLRPAHFRAGQTVESGRHTNTVV